MKSIKQIWVLTTCFVLSHSVSLFADGIAPVDKDGRSLNFGFEDGTLKDWLPEGNSFSGQPVRDDLIAKRNGPGGTSAHHGNYWIGGYEIVGDDGMGTLASVPFKVTHPWASFLVAGGNWPATRVELIDQATQKAFFKVSGEESEHLRPVVVDLKEYIGKEIFIRLVDQQKGHWGHINFDDFQFYATRPQLADEIDPKKQVEVPEADKVLFEGLSPEDAVAKMTLPPGFKATLFAAEPDVKQPIAFTIDDRGRLWVAEAYTYPIRNGTAPDKRQENPTPQQLKDIFGGKDRILCFEDTDGDGKFNKRTVVAENLNLISGLEVGFGGIFVGAAPYLMFLPIENWDNPKAGAPKVLLDGFAYQDTHETLNTFTWGPDGWLYGCHGVFTHSNVGKPGAPDSERVRINAGIFRYHPTKKIFEVFAEGTSNPWGIDFDEHGQLFEEACVIPHLFHMVQGGRFHRQAGSHFNPYTFDDIKNCADHVHWAGSKGPHAANGRSDAAGGGHAHAGLMIYQGDNWPPEYRGKIFIGNIHGQRINMDVPERKGSGFVGHHAPDPINFNDRWSQVLNFRSGPDGAVYFIDWYDKNQCHHNNVEGHDRNNGRIYKISYEKGPRQKILKPLAKQTDQNLFRQVVASNPIMDNWWSREGRRLLQERAASGALKPEVVQKSANELRDAMPLSEQQELRLLWTIHSTVGVSEEIALKNLIRKNYEYLRAWTIQLVCEDKEVSDALLNQFVHLAREDRSPVVRLYLASALQRLPVDKRWKVVEGLYSHSEDAGDHNLPLMVWYAAEPLAAVDSARALQMAEQAKLPNILPFTIRRVAAIGTPEAMAAIVESLKRVRNDQQRLEVLNALNLALKGQRSAAMPRGWDEIETKLSDNPNAEIRAQVQSLSLTFGSQRALVSLRKTLADAKADPNARRTALESLLSAKDKELAPLLQQLLSDSALRGQALRGLASYDDAQTPEKILTVYPNLDAAEKRDALNTLVSRASFAKPLIAAVSTERISRKDLSADLVRQLRNLKNDELNSQIEHVWGAMRDTAADKQPLIDKYKTIYRAGGSQPGDASRGRLVFSKTCQQCHTLFETGGKVGPDLTGSNRADLDYILQNICDPNAVIPNDYRASTLETKDDRVITGIVKAQDDKSVTIATPNETLTVPRNEIASLKQNDLSMMPEGLLDPLNEQEVRDLLYYLSRPGQVPMAAGGQ